MCTDSFQCPHFNCEFLSANDASNLILILCNHNNMNISDMVSVQCLLMEILCKTSTAHILKSHLYVSYTIMSVSFK